MQRGKKKRKERKGEYKKKDMIVSRDLRKKCNREHLRQASRGRIHQHSRCEPSAIRSGEEERKRGREGGGEDERKRGREEERKEERMRGREVEEHREARREMLTNKNKKASSEGVR
jgi:hypothetical protein